MLMSVLQLSDANQLFDDLEYSHGLIAGNNMSGRPHSRECNAFVALNPTTDTVAGRPRLVKIFQLIAQLIDKLFVTEEVAYRVQVTIVDDNRA